MSDVWVYTSKGYMNVEQDDYDPPYQYYCNECGAHFHVTEGDSIVCPFDDCNSKDIVDLYTEDGMVEQ